jgi:acetoin utilization deacetylase AcuC-like enzyme
MKTGVVIDERYMAHDTGRGHPERPERIDALLAMLRSRPATGLVRIDPRPAALEDIALHHDQDHIARVAATAGRPAFAFDADTPTGARSYEVALLAAGGLVTLVEAIMRGELDNGFAMVRPPGHHAETDRAMGFCLFNNVAIAARVLRQRYGLERVVIMDWDLHHGNGTQHGFYDDPGVLYVSTHQYPFYPGTGAVDETGHGAGAGFTVNVPLSAGSGDGEFAEAFGRIVEPVVRQYRPQFVLVSAGFDCHRRDPLGHLAATEEGIAMMTRALLRGAHASAEGRLALVLEGGYDLQAVANCTGRVLDCLGGAGLAEATPIVPGGSTTEPVREVQRRYWDL